MGDIADYYYTDGYGYDDIEEEIEATLEKSNDFLFSLTKGSKDPLIVGIRDYYTKYNKLSEKQRYCLAKHIVLEIY